VAITAHKAHNYYVHFICNLIFVSSIAENVGVRPGRLQIESTRCS